MKYYEVTVKFGHVGKNKYYKGNVYLKAENGKEAAQKARSCPRVKHDHKDAILSVVELDYETFQTHFDHNREISYFSCYNVQEQRDCICEIQDQIFQETRFEEEPVKRTKKHNLRNKYNDDPEYEFYKSRKCCDWCAA
ncbi:MAG: hypothetical protein KBT21_10425 [Treponema sp.]|nr:hypothetical protein [Candidatus Treponema merdequi]